MVSGRVRSTEGTEGTEGTDGTEGTEYGVGRTIRTEGWFFVRLLGGMVSITGSMGWSRGCVCVCVSVYQVCVCVCVCVCRGCCAPARRAGSLRRARRFLLLGFFNESTDCRRSADLLIESRSRPQLAENSGFPRTSAYPAYSPVCLVHELSWRQLAPSDKQASGTA